MQGGRCPRSSAYGASDRQRRELPSGRRGQPPSAGAAGLRPPRPAHRPGGLPSLVACADGQVPRRGVGVAVRARHQAGPLGGKRRGAVPAQPGRVRHDLSVDHDLGRHPAARARDRAVAGAEGQALQRRLRRARPAAGRQAVDLRRHGHDREAGRLGRARQHHHGHAAGRRRARPRVRDPRPQVVLLGADVRCAPGRRPHPGRRAFVLLRAALEGRTAARTRCRSSA